MYWNRDIFSAAGIANPPKDWSSFSIFPKSLRTVIRKAATFRRAAWRLALCKRLAREKRSWLRFSCSQGIHRRLECAVFRFRCRPSQKRPDLADLCSEFLYAVLESDQTVYFLDASLPDSKSMFLSGRLGIYFGLASEYAELRSKNPNLNFDVTYLPQSQGHKGDLWRSLFDSVHYRFAKTATGIDGVTRLTAEDSIARWSELTRCAGTAHVPVPASDPNLTIFSNSALFSKGWLDPNHYATDNVFKTMIDSISSGAMEPLEAVGKAERASILCTMKKLMVRKTHHFVVRSSLLVAV